MSRGGQLPMFDPDEARRLLAEGIERVLKHGDPGWEDRARAVVFDVACDYDKFTFDRVREYAYRAGLPNPRHHNEWGGVMNRCAGEGWLMDTGRVEWSRRTAAHRRKLTVWRSLIGPASRGES